MSACEEYGHRWETDVYDLGGHMYVNVWCDYCGIEMSFEQDLESQNVDV